MALDKLNYSDEILEKLTQLGVELHENWFDDKFIDNKDYQNLFFWKILSTKNLGYQSVPLDKIVGTTHSNYANSTWLLNLVRLKRFEKSYTKDSLIKYFNSSAEKEHISFYKYGDDYIINEGNHRTHFARFLGYKYIKGKVCEYFFDYKRYLYFISCKKILEGYKKEGFINNEELNNILEKCKQGIVVVSLELNNQSMTLKGLRGVQEFISMYKSTIKPSSLEYIVIIFLNNFFVVYKYKKSNYRGHFVQFNDIKNNLFKLRLEFKQRKYESVKYN